MSEYVVKLIVLILILTLQHKYHTKIDEMIEKTSASMRLQLVGKLLSVLGKQTELNSDCACASG